MLTPAGVFGTWFRGLLAVTLIGAGIWLVWSWYDQLPDSTPLVTDRAPAGTETSERHTRRPTRGERVLAWRPAFDQATLMLAVGVGLGLWSLTGRILNPLLWRKGASE